MLAVLIFAAILGGMAAFTNLLKNNSDSLPIPFTIEKQYSENGTTVITGSFKQALPEGETLWLYVENAKVVLSVDDFVSL